ncbi:hypothetical protein [Streptomyces sp. NPDC049915]|uniref:hypothetical protein n=1 Tax=Streptomyces sp. NPDC049915 TaxID=3155510 RepID=UPI00343EE2FD
MTKKRAALTTAALTACCLAALTACSGGGADASDKPSTSAAQARQAGPAGRLAQLMVTPAEVTGHTVKEADAEFRFAASPSEVSVDKAACAPLAYAMNQLPLGEPQADLTRFVSTGRMNDAATYITLASYAPGGASSALTDLFRAVTACRGGFTAKAKNGSTIYTSVASEQPVRPAGGQTVAFKATMTVNGVTHTLHTEAVRADDVVAVYFSVNGMAIASGTPSDAKLDATAVGAQNAKLG